MAGVCAVHPERDASFTCARCGDNGCEDCVHRVVPTASPICAGCWRMREERVARLGKDDGSYVCRAAVITGVLGLVPCLWPMQLGSLLLAVVGLRRSRPGTRARTLAWVGGGLGVLGLVGDAVLFIVTGTLAGFP